MPYHILPYPTSHFPSTVGLARLLDQHMGLRVARCLYLGYSWRGWMRRDRPSSAGEVMGFLHRLSSIGVRGKLFHKVYVYAFVRAPT